MESGGRSLINHHATSLDQLSKIGLEIASSARDQHPLAHRWRCQILRHNPLPVGKGQSRSVSRGPECHFSIQSKEQAKGFTGGCPSLGIPEAARNHPRVLRPHWTRMPRTGAPRFPEVDTMNTIGPQDLA